MTARTRPAKRTADDDSGQRAPLFPMKIEVLGLGGEYESGKTLFGLSICPEVGATRYYDFEKSGATYEGLGAVRVDVPAEMLKRFPNGDHKPIDVFKWWRQDVRSLRPDQYRVILCDTANDLELGLVDYVMANPREFGRTPNQYWKMKGLAWGDAKSLLKNVLTDLASRCECFAFTSHMGFVWKGDAPTQERKVKGKETFMELSSLYLVLERRVDETGVKQAVPSARLLKSRLAKTEILNGNVIARPCLPPRIPQATPQAIREYIDNPPNYADLKEEEKAPPEKMSRDERLKLRAEIAGAERDREQARAARESNPGPRTEKVVRKKREEVQPAESDPCDKCENPECPGCNGPDAGKHSDMVDALQDALNDPPKVEDVDPSSPPSASLLARLDVAIEQWRRHDESFDVDAAILRAITRRDPDASELSELTTGQLEEIEANILGIIRPAVVTQADDGSGEVAEAIEDANKDAKKNAKKDRGSKRR